jgi:hypothetical protein
MAFAQNAQAVEPITFEGATLDQSSARLPALSLEDQDRFFFATAFGSPRPTSYYLPPFYAWESSGPYRAMPGQRNVVEELTDLRAPSRIYFGGEIGFLYGKSTGTYGREDFAGYIIGTVGNEKFSITAGYYRQETNFETPRHRR